MLRSQFLGSWFRVNYLLLPPCIDVPPFSLERPQRDWWSEKFALFDQTTNKSAQLNLTRRQIGLCWVSKRTNLVFVCHDGHNPTSLKFSVSETWRSQWTPCESACILEFDELCFCHYNLFLWCFSWEFVCLCEKPHRSRHSWHFHPISRFLRPLFCRLPLFFLWHPRDKLWFPWRCAVMSSWKVSWLWSDVPFGGFCWHMACPLAGLEKNKRLRRGALVGMMADEVFGRDATDWLNSRWQLGETKSLTRVIQTWLPSSFCDFLLCTMVFVGMKTREHRTGPNCPTQCQSAFRGILFRQDKLLQTQTQNESFQSVGTGFPMHFGPSHCFVLLLTVSVARTAGCPLKETIWRRESGTGTIRKRKNFLEE